MEVKYNFQGKDIVGEWKLIRSLKSSANGDIFVCRKVNNDLDEKIIKICKKRTIKGHIRFASEIRSLLMAQDIPGIVHVYDYRLPDKGNLDVVPFYVVPFGKDFYDLCIEKSLKEIINIFLVIGNALHVIHKLGIYHRDIKYSNFLFIDYFPTLIDFGIVKMKGGPDITGNFAIGPKYTMAPEVRFISKESRKEIDWEKVDVYSFAKTLWIILAKQKTGFEGPYIESSNSSLRNFVSDYNLDVIDKAIASATVNDPSIRFTLREFLSEIVKWTLIKSDFTKVKYYQWHRQVKKIFGEYIPNFVQFTDKKKVFEILDGFVSKNSTSHFLFSSGGGLDGKSIRRYKNNEIELIDDRNTAHNLFVESLYFHTVGKDLVNSFFFIKVGEREYPSSTEMCDASSNWRSFYRDEKSGKYSGDYEGERNGYPIKESEENVLFWTSGFIIILSNVSHACLTMSDYLAPKEIYDDGTLIKDYFLTNLGENA